MQLKTKKYGGDPLRTYKVLMRKLSKEGVYQELREKEYFKSKSQKRREEEMRNTARTKKKLRIIRENIENEVATRKFKKPQHQQKKVN